MISDLFRDFPLLAGVGAHGYLVGGAVRDAMLGEHPADVDIACVDAEAAARELARKARRKVIPLGHERFGAFRVVTEQGTYDFAELTGGSIENDLGRRDFTINAMAITLDGHRLLDPHGGQKDLQDRLVRMVSTQNFDDDPLRMLKAVRMAMRYGFEIEPATVRAIRERAGAIETIAAERVTYELTTILGLAPLPRALGLLHETRFDEVLFGPARSALECGSLLPLSEPIDADDARVIAFALIFAGAAAAAGRFAERWRWSDALTRSVLALIHFVEERRAGARDPRSLVIPMYDAGEVTARRAVALLRANHEDEVAAPIDELLRERGEAIFSTVPLLTGTEIGELTGIAAGPEIGRLKRALLEAQLRGEVTDRAGAEQWMTGNGARRRAAQSSPGLGPGNEGAV
jgi:tRNA nucleotidyltransferase/poly(A) polymerase